MKRGTVLILLGLLLLAAALGIFVVSSARGSITSAKLKNVLEELSPVIEKAAVDAPKPLDREEISSASKYTEIPDYQLNPMMELPVHEVDGKNYVGILCFTANGLALPVLQQQEGETAPLAPCVYSGTPYSGRFEVYAGDVSRKNGILSSASIGSTLVFTDVDGNSFMYITAEVMQLPGREISLTTSEWELTVYVPGGNGIFAIGCERNN